MGKTLVTYYDKAKEIGGVEAKIKLIKLVALSVSQAEVLPDSPAMVAKFEDALKQIKREL